MKKIVCLFLLITVSLAGFSQIKLDYTATPKTQAKGFSAKGLTAESASLLALLRHADDPLATPAERKSALNQIQNHHAVSGGMVSAMLTLAYGHDAQELAAYEVTVGSEAGGIHTAMIPLGRFAELAASGICRQIDVGNPLQPMMDVARNNLGIDMIHAGLHLPQGYDGSGVVVGIIDGGFEYTHPAFYDTTGQVHRVKRVWIQHDSTGTAPDGYSYGSEYTTESQMAAVMTDNTMANHGTHVAGIAAGCGAPFGDGAAYRGIAPGADIVLVSDLPTVANALDAIRYIHEYARSVSKPCVINMSFGYPLGPHDGTAMQDQYLTSYVAQHPDSLALVTAAGNSGKSNDHIEKQFTPADTELITNLHFLTMPDFKASVGLWNDRDFSFALTLVNSFTLEQEDFTGFFTASADSLIETQLMANDSSKFDLKISLLGKDSLNDRYHATIVATDNISYGEKVFLTVRCDSTAHLHGWSADFYFNASNLVSGSVDGDSHYTMAGFGANTDAVISVGSYATKLEYTSYNGNHYTDSYDSQLYGLSSFSSLGPTVDGRVKPDITAPGEVIAAPYNRFASQALVEICDTIVWNGQIERYGTELGTSMSSPIVAGIIALWMQHNPSLGTDSLRNILHRTARNDRFTGNTVTNPNNSWGYGKVNAFGGLPATDIPVWQLNVIVCDDATGTVTGSGLVAEGYHTVTATPVSPYVFERWDDGNTDNPRIVFVDCDTTFAAVFAIDCQPVTEFPWEAEFNEAFSCWNVIDNDGDGQMWRASAQGAYSTGHANADNWLISPVIDLNRPLMANIMAKATTPPGSSQDLSLLLSTTGSEMEDFTTTLATFSSQSIGNINLTAPLNEYQGQQVRLALRHHNCTGTVLLVTLNSFVIEDDTIVSVSNHELTDCIIATSGLQFTISGAERLPLQVFDMMGRLVVNASSASGTFCVPAPGVYIVRIGGLKPRKILLIR